MMFTHKSNKFYFSDIVGNMRYGHIFSDSKMIALYQNNWHGSCTICWHTAPAVNKNLGGAQWLATALTMAIANATPAPAGNSLTEPLLLTKWAGAYVPTITFITSMVSKLTTAIQALLSSRHLAMTKFIIRNDFIACISMHIFNERSVFKR